MTGCQKNINEPPETFSFKDTSSEKLLLKLGLTFNAKIFRNFDVSFNNKVQEVQQILGISDHDILKIQPQKKCVAHVHLFPNKRNFETMKELQKFSDTHVSSVNDMKLTSKQFLNLWLKSCFYRGHQTVDQPEGFNYQKI